MRGASAALEEEEDQAAFGSKIPATSFGNLIAWFPLYLSHSQSPKFLNGRLR